MDFSNPLEIVLTVFLAVFSVWIIERIIAGAFKTVVLGILFFGLVFVFTLHNHDQHRLKHLKSLPRFTVHDLTDYDSFKKKLDPYTKETITDVKYNFDAAKKNLEK